MKQMHHKKEGNVNVIIPLTQLPPQICPQKPISDAEKPLRSKGSFFAEATNAHRSITEDSLPEQKMTPDFPLRSFLRQIP